MLEPQAQQCQVVAFEVGSVERAQKLLVELGPFLERECLAGRAILSHCGQGRVWQEVKAWLELPAPDLVLDF